MDFGRAAEKLIADACNLLSQCDGLDWKALPLGEVALFCGIPEPAQLSPGICCRCLPFRLVPSI